MIRCAVNKQKAIEGRNKGMENGGRLWFAAVITDCTVVNVVAVVKGGFGGGYDG